MGPNGRKEAAQQGSTQLVDEVNQGVLLCLLPYQNGKEVVRAIDGLKGCRTGVNGRQTVRQRTPEEAELAGGVRPSKTGSGSLSAPNLWYNESAWPHPQTGGSRIPLGPTEKLRDDARASLPAAN